MDKSRKNFPLFTVISELRTLKIMPEISTSFMNSASVCIPVYANVPVHTHTHIRYRVHANVFSLGLCSSVIQLPQHSSPGHYSVPQSRQSAKLYLQSSELGLPQPLTRRRVCPPPLVPGGGAPLLAREGGGRVPIPTRGNTLTVVLCRCMCFVLCTYLKLTLLSSNKKI